MSQFSTRDETQAIGEVNSLAAGLRGDGRGLFHDFERGVALGDHDRLKGCDIFENLLCVARRPGDRQPRNTACVTESE